MTPTRVERMTLWKHFKLESHALIHWARGPIIITFKVASTFKLAAPHRFADSTLRHQSGFLKLAFALWSLKLPSFKFPKLSDGYRARDSHVQTCAAHLFSGTVAKIEVQSWYWHVRSHVRQAQCIAFSVWQCFPAKTLIPGGSYHFILVPQQTRFLVFFSSREVLPCLHSEPFDPSTCRVDLIWFSGVYCPLVTTMKSLESFENSDICISNVNLETSN